MTQSRSRSSEDDEKRYKVAVSVLQRARGFQDKKQQYSRLLQEGSELVRLEVLSYAADDRVWIQPEELARVLRVGSELERRYALLILARNNHLSDYEIDQADIGSGLEADSWRLASRYAANPTLTRLLLLLEYLSTSDVSVSALALNLSVTVANAVHRVILYDILKIIQTSRVADRRMEAPLSSALRQLGLRSSWTAIREYQFNAEELWTLFR